ncbi:hypothetical protein ACE1AT_03455 [Pelatocladus sp. BLCC-F211]|uniref:hypothetical protein n=1 Tax=Pelatocladus sp. BLCC-F211 TaxID=3342752 RepID=UPI0035BAE243
MKLTHTFIAVTTGFAVSLSPVFLQKASAQNLADPRTNQLAQVICADLNAGRSFAELTAQWAQYVESEISMNRFSAERRNEAYRFFGNVTVQAVKTYCPAHIQALYQFAQQAPSYTPSSDATSRVYNEFNRSGLPNVLFRR